MPTLALLGTGGWLMIGWSYAHPNVVALRIPGPTILAVVFVLALWVVLRRMKDTGALLPWSLGIAVGGRLAQAAVLLAGGARDQRDAALGLFFLIALAALGCMPTKRPQAPDEGAGREPETGVAL